MLRFENIESLKNSIATWRQAGETIAFVPTMGALHEGHLSLVKLARESADRVVVSIFVNPTQFGMGEDFDVYPRTVEEDAAFLVREGADGLFLPENKHIYPEGYQTYVTNQDLAGILCGESRPGHFRGVLTVVLKLFNIVNPDCAVFGLKDYQQYVLIRTMVRDFCLNLDILGAETIRDTDGLAMSSRNKNLSPENRKVAPDIFKSLKMAREAYQNGVRNKHELIEAFQQRLLISGRFEIDYVDVRESVTLNEYGEKNGRAPMMLCAARLGTVRLIDNICLE